MRRVFQRATTDPRPALHSFLRKYNGLVSTDAQRKTIYALSTPLGKAGVAVIRISGPDALLAWKGMVRSTKLKHFPPEPWKMERCSIVHPKDGFGQIDDGLAVFFRGKR